MRKFINIVNEGLATDPALNWRIERVLKTLNDDEFANRVRICLQVLKQAGPEGLTKDEWEQRAREAGAFPTNGSLLTTSHYFDFCVVFIPDGSKDEWGGRQGKWVWVEQTKYLN